MNDGSDVTGASVSFASSNPNVAEVNSTSGVITALVTGVTDITEILTRDGVLKTVTVSLTGRPAVGSLEFSA